MGWISRFSSPFRYWRAIQPEHGQLDAYKHDYAPTARFAHTAVWTGSEMIVWGGNDGNTGVDTGGRYNPDTDTWTPTNTTNAADGRDSHKAVWTNSEMICVGRHRF